VWLLAAMAAFGAATELLQHFTGRDASWVDLLGDVIGAAIPLILVTWPRHRLLAGLLAAALATVACAPLAWALIAYAYRSQQAPLIWRADSALLGKFAQWQQGNYPGLALEEVPPDWRGYRELLITVTNPNEEATEFSLMAYDNRQIYRYKDSYKRSFVVPQHSTQTFRVPIEDIGRNSAGRAVDLESMGNLVVFQINETGLQRIKILRISLSH
jgi:4-amino-4-deoxy-L-arabinose transferase-like glycosyltransferase